MTAAKPTRARIRSYNVGFGDCFLLTFFYGKDDTRDILIDFGSTKDSPFGPAKGMLAIAEKIREDSGGKLDMVVATHRHKDHISGFGGDPGDVIASLKPELVLQPWTEDPELEPDARGRPDAAGGRGAPGLVARLANMQAVAKAVHDEVPKLKESPHVRKTVREQLEFLGDTNIANRDAVVNLMNMGKRSVYANFGTELDVAELLPGVGLEVLGPPTLEQSGEIADQREKDPDEFWQLAAASAAAAVAAGGKRRPPKPKLLFPDAAVPTETANQEGRWVIPEIERMRSEEMLAIVRSLDSALNNTSLILLFEVGDTRLLFPGDAQIENWSYALFTAPNHEEIQKRLATAAFYKVGHHGSLNATPKTLWRGFKRANEKKTPDRLSTMVSTLAGKHGSEARGTEVPRKLLVTELEHKSNFQDTETLRTPDEFWNDVEFEF